MLPAEGDTHWGSRASQSNIADEVQTKDALPAAAAWRAGALSDAALRCFDAGWFVWVRNNRMGPEAGRAVGEGLAGLGMLQKLYLT